MRQRATFGDRERIFEVACLDDDEAEHDVFGFREGAVGDGQLFASHGLAGALQRNTGVFELAFGFELFDPGDPGLQALLGALGRAHGLLVVFFGAAQQKYEFCHDFLETFGCRRPGHFLLVPSGRAARLAQRGAFWLARHVRRRASSAADPAPRDAQQCTGCERLRHAELEAE